MSNRINLGNIKGATGATGPPGINGANGLTPEIRNGNWWIGLQDLGVQAEGNKWYKGSAVPTDQGINGDLYLRTTTNDVYYKESGVWGIVTNIKGDKGDTALTVEIGTVTTVSPNTPASVTNSGTNTDIVLDFELPKGEAGGVPVTSTSNQVYATDANGNQTTFNYDTALNNVVNNIVRRVGLNGNIVVPETPLSNVHATSKTYVDNNFVNVNGYGFLADLNTLVFENKTYFINQNTANTPNNETMWGDVQYIRGGENWVTQIVNVNDGHYFYKRSYANGAWGNWRKFVDETYNVKGYAEGGFSASGTDITFNGVWGGTMVNFGNEMTITTHGNPIKIEISLWGKYEYGSNFLGFEIDGVWEGQHITMSNNTMDWVTQSAIIQLPAGTHTIQVKQGGNNNGTLTLGAWNNCRIYAIEL